ncbi:MAG TPA: hypothetical protein VIY49_08615 [Bryobacteraceae bacterium]
MAITLADEIERYILDSSRRAEDLFSTSDGRLMVIKYLPAKCVQDAIANQRLYATEKPGFTWGDALYVAPVEFPRTTMMYGEVGIVGLYAVNQATRFFDGADTPGISLYQRWIALQGRPYTELTTTVHSNLANQELRNEFRNRFKIDCVYFRPDEPCADYVDVDKDWWLAITNWDFTGLVCSGFSKAISDLKWCVVRPDSFQPEGRGFKAALHTSVTSGHSSYVIGHYSSLVSDIKGAYSSNGVVICDFK